MMLPNFEVSLRKGTLAEEIIREKLEERGWVVYRPKTAGAHCFDMLCMKNKKEVIAIDVKSKARMNKFPATGIDYKNFLEYKSFSETHLINFWVIFVDEFKQMIYGNTIVELEKLRTENGKNYPFMMETKRGAKIRLWPLSAMLKIADLDDKQSENLKCLNQRNYNYE
jgi:Holliday junction resolvase